MIRRLLRLGLMMRPQRWCDEVGPAPKRCQWLDGDGPFRDADKCGRETVVGSAYCHTHLERSRDVVETRSSSPLEGASLCSRRRRPKAGLRLAGARAARRRGRKRR